MSSKAPALPIFRKTPPDLRPAKPDRRPEYFLIFEIVCQVALLVPMLGAIRSVMRMAAFSGSLFMLAVTKWSARKVPGMEYRHDGYKVVGPPDGTTYRYPEKIRAVRRCPVPDSAGATS
jgi:hypothetical protein